MVKYGSCDGEIRQLRAMVKYGNCDGEIRQLRALRLQWNADSDFWLGGGTSSSTRTSTGWY
jgi:hypothetical protein